MSFTSPFFLAFFLLIFFLYYLIGRPGPRLVLLLAASFGFYLALGAYYLAAILVLIIGITYLFGLAIAKAGERAKKAWFISAVILDLLPLLATRYLPLLQAPLQNLATALKLPALELKMPLLITIGISFYTFQAISYLIDIYLETQEPEHNFLKFALYLAFFPKLLQGPIERAADLLPQLSLDQPFDYATVRRGFLLFAWGYFQKVIIADRLAQMINPVFANVHDYSGMPLLFSAFSFSWQIFFDFAGYTTMALGIALTFGIHLTNNFNAPYLATSVADFWRRWHITFSRWILDYIFKPLQFTWRRLGPWGTAFALLVTFFLSGLWHGAQYGFIIWGLLHGIFLAVPVLFTALRNALRKGKRTKRKTASPSFAGLITRAAQIGVTFCLVTFAWIFFRANTVNDAFYFVTHMFQNVWIRTCFRGFLHLPAVCQNLELFSGNFQRENEVILVTGLLIYALVSLFGKRISAQRFPAVLRWGTYLAFLALLMLGFFLFETNNANYQSFLYFKF
jgi:alginate O-acetyltransferase complex protein AlgI